MPRVSRGRPRGRPEDEPGPRLPGGGPAGWSPGQYPVSWSRRVVAALLVAGAGFTVAGLVLVVGRGPVPDIDAENATGLFTLAGWVVPLGVAGWCLFFPAWRRSRVADDMRVYAAGMVCGIGLEELGDGGVARVVEVDGRRYEVFRHARVPDRPDVAVDGARHRLEVDDGPREGARWVRGDGSVRATLVGDACGSWIDWTFEVDGRVLRLRAPASGAAPKRATLLDDLGRAWLVRPGAPLGLRARLPEDLTDAGAVFVVWCTEDLVRDRWPRRPSRGCGVPDPGSQR